MKRVISICLAFCMVLSMLTFVPAMAMAEDAGIFFGEYAEEYYPRVKQGDHLYYIKETPGSAPHTYEAWVTIPADTTEAGVLLGNYNEGAESHVNIEVTAKGAPLYRFSDSRGNTYTVTFDGVNLFTGERTHLAVVHDGNSGVISCYVNGVLAGKDYFYPDYDKETFNTHLTIGGDSQYQNHPPFQGSISEITIYYDARTASEVKSDCENGADVTDDDIYVSYNMTSDKACLDIEDESPNGIGLLYSNMWLTEEEMEQKRVSSDFERAYSFAVIGDTQYSTQFYPENLNKLYQWIVDNKEEQNIQYVMGVGDITNRDTTYEWEIAKNAISLMDGVVPYSLVRGNHDLKTYSASANSNYHKDQTGVSLSLSASTGGAGFDNYFANDPDYTDQFMNAGDNGGVYDQGSVMNTWRIFEIANSKWLLLNLDYKVNDSVLAWASDVVDSHPDHKVIITTHGYIGRNGEHLDEAAYAKEKGTATTLPSGGRAVNLGIHQWEKFVSQHKNIQLMLCGHINSSRIVTVQREGKYGNTVTEMLVDGQTYDSRFRGAGLITMLYFNADGTACEVEYISTASESEGRYYRSVNQFTVDFTAKGIPYDETEWNTLALAPKGTGAYNDPYLIENAGNLYWMSQNITATAGVGSFYGKFFKQTNDIDLSGKMINSIGYKYTSDTDIYAFGGVYDGCGYSIKNGRIGPVSDVNPATKGYGYGLFGMLYGGTVKNVTLDNIEVVGRGITGAVVGKTAGKGDGSSDEGFNVVANCVVKDNCKIKTLLPNGAKSPTSTAFDGDTRSGIVGGVVGMARSATVKYCTSSMKLSVGGDFSIVGGIVGSAGYNAVIDHCVYTGGISLVDGLSAAEMAVGGILGATTADAETLDVADNHAGILHVTNCYNNANLEYTGDIAPTVHSSFGGIIGVVAKLHPLEASATRPAVDAVTPYMVYNCHNLYALGATSTDLDTVGGLIGKGLATAAGEDNATMWLQRSSSVSITRRYTSDAKERGYNTFSYINYSTKYGFKPIAVVSDVTGTAQTSGDKLKLDATVVKTYTNAIDSDIATYKTSTSGSVSYSVDGTTLYITGGGFIADYEAGKAPWTEEAAEVTTLIIGDGISAIGDYAFYGLEKLKTVTILGNIAAVGDYAFEGTAFVNETESWEKDLLYIGGTLIKARKNEDGIYNMDVNTARVSAGAFDGTDVKVIYYGGNKAGYLAIQNIEALSDVQAVYEGDNVNYLFDENTGVLRVFGTGVTHTFDSKSTDTPYYRFKDKITSIVVEEGITGLGNYLAKGFTNVTSVTLPEGLTSIGTACFSGQRFESIVLPESLESIGNYAFEAVTSLKSVDIPQSVTSLNRYAFDGCTSLATVTGGEGITAMGQNAFRNTAFLKNADTSKGILVVGNTVAVAFATSDNCYTIPKNIKTVAINAFNGLTVKTVTFTGTADEWASLNIGTGNTSLTSATVTFGEGMHWEYDETTKTLTISGKGVMGNYNEKTGNYSPWYDLRDEVVSLVVEEGITTVGDRAFKSFSKLKNVSLPEGITYIGTGAFELSAVEKVDLPSTVTTMKNYVFSNSEIKEATIPAGLTAIGTHLFHLCESLEKVTIPVSVKSIGKNSFNGCTALTDIYYDGYKSDWDAITLAEGNTQLSVATLHAKQKPLATVTINEDGNEAVLSLGRGARKLYWGYIGTENIEYKWFNDFVTQCGATYTADYSLKDGKTYPLTSKGYYRFVVNYLTEEGVSTDLVYTLEVKEGTPVTVPVIEGDKNTATVNGNARKLYYGYIGEKLTQYTSFNEFKATCGDTFTADFSVTDGEKYLLTKKGYYRFVVNYVDGSGAVRDIVYTVECTSDTKAPELTYEDSVVSLVKNGNKVNKLYIGYFGDEVSVDSWEDYTSLAKARMCVLSPADDYTTSLKNQGCYIILVNYTDAVGKSRDIFITVNN